MANYLGFELYQGAYKIIHKLARVQPGETVAITADTLTEEDLVNALAGAVVQAGGKPLVLWMVTPSGVGKASDADLPYKAIGAAVGNSDVWIEIGFMWLVYSSAYEIGFKLNPKLRHVQMAGLTVDQTDRLINKLDYDLQAEFQTKIIGLTKAAKHVRMTSPAGTELEFDNDHNCPFSSELGIADSPGSHFLAGQMCWFPIHESLNGTLVFDGALNPPCGILKAPVTLKLVGGNVVDILGGEDAMKFKKFLAEFNDPLMYRMAHVCYGFNAGARIVGNGLEDERVWGSVEWGLGYLSPTSCPPDGIDAPSHTDGVCLNSSVWLDGVPLMLDGEVVHPEVAGLAKKLHKNLYRG